METIAPFQSPRRLSICMIAHFAYGAMAGGSSGSIGGVERQTTIMARWLSARGHRVSVVTWDEGQPDGIELDGVRVLKLCGRDSGLPGLRFVHPRWTSLNHALSRADAKIYYQNCGEYVTGQVALWCRGRSRKFVYSAASDADCDARLPLMTKFRERALYRFGIRYADRIIVQTRTQQRMMHQDFGRDSVVIPMPCPEPPGIAFTPPESPCPGSARVLWVGRICEEKRPDRLLDLAEACPDLRFDLVGPGGDTGYSDRVIQRATRTANVSVHGPAAREQLASFYRRAACLCSTSDHEGFPNTFLEAWSHGLPVVSTLDPDCTIAERGLGVVATDVDGLATAIRRLFTSPDRWRAASASARQYYLENHTVDRVMAQFEQIFLDAVGNPMRSDSGCLRWGHTSVSGEIEGR